MMKKRISALLLTVLMVSAFLTGCGGNSAAYDKFAPMEQAAESPAAPESAGGLYGSSGSIVTDTAVTDQKLIKRVNMDAETEDLEALLPELTAKVAELGGYIESQELYNGSKYASYRSRSVNMTVRIPAQRLAEFVSQVEGASNVVNYTETTDDVTLQYVDTESRIKALEVEQERLLELLAKAENMDDLLRIESRLTEVRYELESYASQLRSLQNQVSYATVRLYISQVKVYTEPEPETVWQRIGSGFTRNLRNIGEDLTDFFVWLTVYSPQLLFWAAVIALAGMVLRRKLCKRRAKKMPPEPEQKEE